MDFPAKKEIGKGEALHYSDSICAGRSTKCFEIAWIMDAPDDPVLRKAFAPLVEIGRLFRDHIREKDGEEMTGRGMAARVRIVPWFVQDGLNASIQ
jgi:hypothetical protein